MADEAPNQERKETGRVHKVVGYGGGLMGALAIISQLKGSFVTREEWTATRAEVLEVRHTQERGFDELKTFMINAQDEQMHKLERLNDKVIDRIKDTETRSQQSDARQERRIDVLEEAILVDGKSKHTN